MILTAADTHLGVWGKTTHAGAEAVGCLVDVTLWRWRDGLFPGSAEEHTPLNRCLWMRRAVYGPHEALRFGQDRCLQFAFREILQHARQYDSFGRSVLQCHSNAKIVRPPRGWKVTVNASSYAVRVARTLSGAGIADVSTVFSPTMLDSRKREVIREFLRHHKDLLKASEIQAALHPSRPAQQATLGNLLAVAGRFTG